MFAYLVIALPGQLPDVLIPSSLAFYYARLVNYHRRTAQTAGALPRPRSRRLPWLDLSGRNFHMFSLPSSVFVIRRRLFSFRGDDNERDVARRRPQTNSSRPPEFESCRVLPRSLLADGELKCRT